MSKPAFLITIDAEGDNLWARPARVETRNARFVPRFQELCERHQLKVTYLVNYEMACCPEFVAFARDVQSRGTGEIGMHLHAWNSPPLVPLTEDDNWHQPYLIEYPPAILGAKITYLTRLLEDTFATRITSHRAGRWGFNGSYARALIENGYQVDCSVTPHVSWELSLGAPFGHGGSDYRRCDEAPYWVDREDPRRAGSSTLLEVPLTIKTPRDPLGRWVFARFDRSALIWRAAQRVRPLLSWMQPDGQNRGAMLWLLDEALRRCDVHAQFTLHSSELMPGGSPRFKDETSIEQLYGDMECLFKATRGRFVGATLSEFHASMSRLSGRSEQPVSVDAGLSQRPAIASSISLAQAP